MRLVRCNRCWAEGDVTLRPSGVAVVDAMAAFAGAGKLSKWSSLVLSPLAGMVKTKSAGTDLCDDCTEVLTEQFLKGAEVKAITRPVGKVELPHDDTLFQDCLLAFDPARGGLICEHDDPERFLWLQRDRAQNVAEGVPEQPVDKTDWVSCKDCGCTSAQGMDNNAARCTCGCHLKYKVEQVVEDVAMAGYAHAFPQRCSAACSEMHTYREGCLLANVVSDVPGQVMPPACGPECEAALGNHTNVFGKCLNNPDTLRAVMVVCPVCKTDGPGDRLITHMDEAHQMVPDHKNHQWVGRDGRNLEGRLISSDGEDLTEAYSYQEPVQEGE